MSPNHTDGALRASYDVVIVGSGIAARAIAYALSHKHGVADVALLQPGPTETIATGPAILRASHGGPAMVELSTAAAQAYRGLPRGVRAEMSPVRRPLLELAFTPAGLVRLTRLADTARHLGHKAWLVPPLEVRSHLPFVRVGEQSVQGALFEPEATVFERLALSRAFAQGAAELGVHVLAGVPVVEVLFDGETAVGVRTPQAEVRAKTLVLAPESTPTRYPGVDIPGVGGPAEALMIDSEPASPIFAAAVVSRRFGTLVQDDAAVTTLSTLVRTGTPTGAARAGSLAALVDAAPGLGGLFLRREKRAPVLTTLDGAPMAGSLRPALHVIAGLGFEHAALALPLAEAIAAEIAGHGSQRLLAPFAPSRFASGRLLAPPAEAAVA